MRQKLLFERGLYDPIRRRQVAMNPEELVRQSLLQQMLGPLGFPKGVISVEVAVGSQGRRADIVVYRSQGSELIPLLLVECKGERLADTSWNQVIGYNASLEAPFWCLAHQGGIETFWHEGERLRSVSFLPPYTQLLSRIGS